jgi:hypothetical protein
VISGHKRKLKKNSRSAILVKMGHSGCKSRNL